MSVGLSWTALRIGLKDNLAGGRRAGGTGGGGEGEGANMKVLLAPVPFVPVRMVWNTRGAVTWYRYLHRFEQEVGASL